MSQTIRDICHAPILREDSVDGPQELVTIDAMSRRGVDAFITHVSATATQFPWTRAGTERFISRIGEDYAFIRLQDIGQPARFLRQMAGAPPVRFSTDGFRADIVDDANPARHYVAFVFVGYWLPKTLAVLVLWMWEIAGFVRYRGIWSWNDMRSGHVGIDHGIFVRHCGPTVLPSLIARDLVHRDYACNGSTQSSEKRSFTDGS